MIILTYQDRSWPFIATPASRLHARKHQTCSLPLGLHMTASGLHLEMFGVCLFVQTGVNNVCVFSVDLAKAKRRPNLCFIQDYNYWQPLSLSCSQPCNPSCIFTQTHHMTLLYFTHLNSESTHVLCHDVLWIAMMIHDVTHTQVDGSWVALCRWCIPVLGFGCRWPRGPISHHQCPGVWEAWLCRASFL